MITERPRLGADMMGVDHSAWWVLGGTGAIIGLYQLLKAPFRATETMPVPPKEPPASFPDMNAVATRFSQVKELYRMGYLSADETASQLGRLMDAADALRDAGKISPGAAADLTSRIGSFFDNIV